MKADSIPSKLSGNGETMNIKIKPEWAGKEIIIMPYLHEPTKKVSVKTKVNLKDGVFLWVETQGTGHTFVSVTINNQTHVFTYGRFDVEYKIMKYALIEEGTLIIYKDEVAARYITETLYKVTPQVYEIKDVDPYDVRNEFGIIWAKSNEKLDDIGESSQIDKDKKVYGKVIDTYIVWSNNCTTLSCEILIKCGTKIFGNNTSGFTIPSSLQKYLLTLKNPDVENATQYIHKLYPNTTGLLPNPGAGSSGESSGASGESSGTIANSSN